MAIPGTLTGVLDAARAVAAARDAHLADAAAAAAAPPPGDPPPDAGQYGA